MRRIEFGKYRNVNKEHLVTIIKSQYDKFVDNGGSHMVTQVNGVWKRKYTLTHELEIRDDSDLGYGFAFLWWVNSRIVDDSIEKKTLKTPSDLKHPEILDIAAIYTFDIQTLEELNRLAKITLISPYSVSKGVSDKFYSDPQILVDRTDNNITKVISRNKLKIPTYTIFDSAWERELASIVTNRNSPNVMAFDSNSMYFGTSIKTDLLAYLTIRKAMFSNVIPYPTVSDALVYRAIGYRVPDMRCHDINNGGHGDCSFRTLYAILSRRDQESLYDTGLFHKMGSREGKDAEDFGKIAIALYVIRVLYEQINSNSAVNVFSDLPAYFMDIRNLWTKVGSYENAIRSLLSEEANDQIGTWRADLMTPTYEAKWGAYGRKNYLTFILNEGGGHFVARFVGEEGERSAPQRRDPKSSDYADSFSGMSTKEIIEGYFSYTGRRFRIKATPVGDFENYDYELSCLYYGDYDRTRANKPLDAHWKRLDEVLKACVLDSQFSSLPSAFVTKKFRLAVSLGIDNLGRVTGATGFEKMLVDVFIPYSNL